MRCPFLVEIVYQVRFQLSLLFCGQARIELILFFTNWTCLLHEVFRNSAPGIEAEGLPA